MKFEKKIVALSVLCGVLIWVFDAGLDFLFYYEGTFLQLLIYDVPGHEIYIRVLILLVFLVFGLTVSRITIQRKEALEETAQSKEYLRITLRSIGDAVISTDVDGRVVTMNPVAESLTGWSEKEAVGQPLDEVFRIINEQTRQTGESPVTNVLKTGQIVGLANHTLLIAKDGKETPITDSGAPIKNSDGETTGVVLVFRDQSEERTAQRALKASEEMMRNSQSVAHICSYSTNLNENEIEKSQWVCSPEFYKLFGIDETYPHTIAGWVGFIHTDFRDEVVAYHESVVNEKTLFNKEYKIIRINDGEERWVHGTGELEFDEKGIPVRMHGAIQDITERKQAEEEKEKLQAQLTQAQKIESVGRLAGGVAHDFNNMLGVILGYAQLAMRKIGPDAPLYSNLDEIHKAAERSADLTRQLLAFARQQTVAPKVLDLNETVNGMLNMLRRLIGEDMDLAWRPGSNLRSVFIDPSQVDQILTNLCVNARDAIADMGKITIETATVSFDDAYCSDHAGFVPGEFVMLAVSDDGCGMDAEPLSHLFEPFFSTKEMGKGTGLGLATVHGIVKQNNGFINVYSEPGHGTTFKICLPQHAAKAAPRPEQEQAPVLTAGGEIILLVEDEPAILEVTSMMLVEMGYAVIAAGSPGAAIGLAREHLGRIDLLITDVVMPEMNGRDLAGNIMAMYPDIRRLFMSGYTANVIAHHGVLDPGVHFLQKPFSMKDLATKIREALKRENPTREGL